MNNKLLLIGWDGADWRAINPLLDSGKMPHLQKLIDGGTCGNIATLQPVLSPMLWTSIATGKRPYKHGIHGFTEPDPVTGSVRPVTNLSRSTKAMWNILNQEAHKTLTVGWWPSNPAEPLSHGAMVSNLFEKATGNTYDPDKWPLRDDLVHPPRIHSLVKELRLHPAEVTPQDLIAFLPGIKDFSQEELDKVSKDQRVQTLMKLIADMSSVHATVTGLMQQEEWDLCSVYYDAIDHFGHAFMKYHPPQQEHIDDWDFKVFHHCVEACYMLQDAMLGTLMHLAGEDTTIMLISDHGFHPDEFRLSAVPNEPAGPAAEHRQFGIFCAKGPGIRVDQRIHGVSLLDICPTILHHFGQPIGRDMDGKVLTDLYTKLPHAVTWIDSWDTRQGDDGMHPADRQISAEDARAGIEQLVALGYIDTPSEDRSKATANTIRELEYNLAQSYMDAGLLLEASELLDQLLEQYPEERRFGMKLINCLMGIGEIERAETLCQQLITTMGEQMQQAHEEMKALGLDDEDQRKAEQERIAKLSAREQQKHAKERRDLLARAYPNIKSLELLRAQIQFYAKDYPAVLEALDHIESQRGPGRAIHRLRARTLIKLRRWQDALDALHQDLKVDQESPITLSLMTRAALGSRDYQTALDYAQQSIGLLFHQPQTHYQHGLAALQLGQWQQAEQSFAHAIKQAPNYVAAWRKLATIARQHHRDAHLASECRQRALDALQHRKSRNRAQHQERMQHQLNLPEDRIETRHWQPIDPSETITIVSGLPRSGTSLMMQALEAAELRIFTDGQRQADASNQKGHYEHEKVMQLQAAKHEDHTWLQDAKGKGLKVVAPLLRSLPLRINQDNQDNQHDQDDQDEQDDQPTPLHYRVIFMVRNLSEVLASQEKMLQRLGKEAPKGNPARAYLQQVNAAVKFLDRHQIPTIFVPYATMVQDPESIIPSLAEHLGVSPHTDAMQAVINPDLYRERSAEDPAPNAS